MKKIYTILLIAAVSGMSIHAQTESYTALRVTGSNTPVIDGTIDHIWQSVPRVPLTKVPKVGGVTHTNITVPSPDPSDFYAEFGMIWGDTGLYVIFGVVDELIVIADDNPNTSTVPNDQWWTDDNINLLFSKDLINNAFVQWEFAWQEGIDQEEKLSSDDWLNAALIDISMVRSAWYQEGTAWTLETFINWKSFDDGFAVITPGMDIYLEARARDDDDIGTWESMYQWSTDNYEVESTGEGLGTVTLSSEEVLPVGIRDLNGTGMSASLVPSYSTARTNLVLSMERPGDVSVTVYDLKGAKVSQYSFGTRTAGEWNLPMNMGQLERGVYLLRVKAGERSEMLKFLKL